MIRLSLIIPTHNRSERLIAALESVIRQDLPAADDEGGVVARMEVEWVDNTVRDLTGLAEALQDHTDRDVSAIIGNGIPQQAYRFVRHKRVTF